MTRLTIAILAFLAIAAGADAHDDAAWIQDDPTYQVAGGGQHCCGPTHCAIAPDDLAIQEGGHWYVPSTHQTFKDGEHNGLYPSVDGKLWECHRFVDGQITYVCLFVPMRG